MTVKAATRSYGGKGTMIAQLLKYFPDPGSYDTFVDAYGGAGTVLLNKPYTQVEIFNDLNRNIYALMTVLTDSALFSEFKRLTELALFDEATSEEYRRSLRDGDLDVVTRAFRYWYVTRTRRTGGDGGFFVNAVVRRRMSKSTSDFLSSVEGLRDLHERLSSVIVRSCDAVKLIGEFDRPRTFIYCDPPYVQSTRTSTRYEVDADDAHHEALVDALNCVKHAYIVLSGYRNSIYDRLGGFERLEFSVATVTGTNVPKTKTETVWRNFNPTRLGLRTLFGGAEFGNGGGDEN